MKHVYTRMERLVILLLLLVIVISSYSLYTTYKQENSVIKPAIGGIYTEGIISRTRILLNPIFEHLNPASAEVNKLIFSGLTKFSPQTGEIEDDLAVSKRSTNNVTYTFTLLPNLFWHDGHPVTSEDILFTYKTIIQNETFAGHFLHQAFKDVTITKIDNRTVSFTLKEPYSFFLSNVTVGLLPKHILELVPVENLEKSDFNQAPIGTGPYIFRSFGKKDNVVDITLSRNENYYGTIPKIETIILHAFQEREELLKSINTLKALKVLPSEKEKFEQESRFSIQSYQLPQYVALFLNTESKILSNKKTRFGLLLSTNKEAISKELGHQSIVDTPILESKTGLDIEYNEERAKGAFFDTDWHLPSKLVQTGKEQQNEKLTFQVKALVDTWIKPKADGKEEEGFILGKGKSKTYTVTTSLSFASIGNAAGLEITANGIPLEPLGKEGEVLRDTTLDLASLAKYMTEDNANTLMKALFPKAESPTNIGLETGEEDLIRTNQKGERLILRLITAKSPPEYLKVAEMIQKEWKKTGVKLIVEAFSIEDLQKKIEERDYDILLFGQNLGYNLDAYPFWHSSQAEKGSNLSKLKSIETDSLLVEIRETFDESEKEKLLTQLKKSIASQTPAIFLYNPTQYLLIDKRVKNVHLSSLASDADRFNDVGSWYIKEELRLREPFSLKNLFTWIWRSS